MPTNEAGVINEICRDIWREWPQAWIFNVVGSPYQMTGVPDLLVCVDGLFVGLEAKFKRDHESIEAARDKATPGQKVQIMKINRAGGAAAVVLSGEEAVDVIRRGLADRERRNA